MMITKTSSRLAVVLCLLASLASASDEIQEEDSHIDLPIVVMIKPSDSLGTTSFRLTVQPSDTVLDLKRMISLHENGKLPIEKQQLYLQSESKPLDVNSNTLSSYKIGHDAEIKLTSVDLDEGTAQANKKKYFGVDAEDQEAVRQRQRELSEEKFKELFGDEVNSDDIIFHADHGSMDDQKVHDGIRGAFKWLYNVVTGKKEEQKGDEKRK